MYGMALIFMQILKIVTAIESKWQHFSTIFIGISTVQCITFVWRNLIRLLHTLTGNFILSFFLCMADEVWQSDAVCLHSGCVVFHFIKESVEIIDLSNKMPFGYPHNP